MFSDIIEGIGQRNEWQILLDFLLILLGHDATTSDCDSSHHHEIDNLIIVVRQARARARPVTSAREVC